MNTTESWRTMKKTVYKIPGGKLVKIFFETSGGAISEIKITGDFFVYPEERIEALEKWLVGAQIEPVALRAHIEKFLSEHKTDLYGISAEGIVTAIHL